MDKLMKARCLSVFIFLACFVSFGAIAQAEEKAQLDSTGDIREMPVMTGHVWQQMTKDGKTAFIWGVGHVVTIEKHVEVKHPELKRSDFTAKLSEGLTGVPMERIVTEVDGYYRDHPDALDTPVMKVIWREIVKPKLTVGIADQPIDKSAGGK